MSLRAAFKITLVVATLAVIGCSSEISTSDSSSARKAKDSTGKTSGTVTSSTTTSSGQTGGSFPVDPAKADGSAEGGEAGDGTTDVQEAVDGDGADDDSAADGSTTDGSAADGSASDGSATDGSASGSGGSGGSTPPPPPPPPTTVDTSVDSGSGGGTIDVEDVVAPPTDDERLSCAQAVLGTSDASNVVSIVNSKTVVTASSIVAISLGGSAQLILQAPIELAGFCLFQRGNSTARFTAGFKFRSLAVFSSGGPTAAFLLADGASLTKFSASAGGNATIGIFSPINLNCTTIIQNAVVNGNPTINCGDHEP